MKPTINIADLTPEQLKQLKTQLKAKAKEQRAGLAERKTLILNMLQEKDESGEWKNTTADILTALQRASLADTDLSQHERKEWLKKIQTVKQKAEKGDLAGKVGYKASATGFGLNATRVVDWLLTHSDQLSPADKKAIMRELQ